MYSYGYKYQKPSRSLVDPLGFFDFNIYSQSYILRRRSVISLFKSATLVSNLFIQSSI